MGAATKSASDIAPIIGTWKDGGAVINVTGGGGSFQGTVVSGSWGACNKGGPGVVVWKGLGGSGFSYSGQFPFVHSNDCSSAGDGPATLTLSDINHGSWSAVSPGDGMTYTGSFSRQGTWPGANNNGGGGITAWVQNILEQMKMKYDPCDYGAVAGGAPNNDCGQQGLKRNPQAWKATGSLVCTTEVSHSFSGPFTPITTGGGVQKCVKEFGPGGERELGRVRSAVHSKPAQAKAGNYRGVSISLAGFRKAASKKQLRRRGHALAAFLRSHKKPRNAQPISFKVGKHGRSATFSPRVSLTCEDGSSLPIDLSDLPDPSAPLSVSRQGYFRLAAEDPSVIAQVGGLFLNKRSLAGTFYLAVRVHQHGLCEAFVGYVARRKG